MMPEKAKGDLEEIARTNAQEIQIVEFREYILSHGALGVQPNRRFEGLDINKPAFLSDLKQGRLKHYGGTYVAYQKGILCGQSKDRNRLYRCASNYYGKSGLAVFLVPVKQQHVRKALKQAIGRV